MDDLGFWGFSSEEGGTSAYVIAAERGLAKPTDASGWLTWQQGAWVLKESVILVPGPGLEEDEALDIRRTIAFLIFGFMMSNLLVLRMMKSENAKVRSQIYSLVSSTLTTVMGICVMESINTFLFKQLLPSPFPRGFGLGSPISATIKIIVGIPLFVASWFGMLFLGWKFQFSRMRLVMLRTFFSSVVSWSSVFTWTQLQRKAAEHGLFGPVMETFGTDPGVGDATSVVVLAFGWFAAFRAASYGFVADQAFDEPPQIPWGGKVESPKYSPMGFLSCGDASMPDRKTKDWLKEVKGAEDDVNVGTISFLINQVLIFSITGHMNGLPGRFIHHPSDEVTLWLKFAGVAFVIALMIFFTRIFVGDGSRTGKIVQRIGVNSVGFCMFRWFNWMLKNKMGGEDSVWADVVTAVAMSTVSIITSLGLRSLGHFLEEVLPQWVMNARNQLKSHAEEGPAEWMSKVVMRCLGMISGVAWDRTFSSSLNTIIEGTPVLQDHFIMWRIILSVGFVALLLPPWYMVILPKSEMTEAEHRTAIEAQKKRDQAATDAQERDSPAPAAGGSSPPGSRLF